MEQHIINDYQQRAQQAQQQASNYEKLANKYSLQRLIVFGFIILSIYLSVVMNDVWIFAFCVVVAVFWFSWLVSRQNKYDDLKQYHTALKKVNENEIENILKHANIYYNGNTFINEKHFYTADLDIFGSGSLFQFVNRAATSPGNYKLAAWLNAAAAKPAILERQEAVKELSEKPDWKLNFQTRLLFCLKQPLNQIKNLVTYLNTTLEIKDERFLWGYSHIAPFLVLLLIVLSVFYPAARYVLGVVILANYRLVSSKKKLVQIADLIAGKIGESLSLYALGFECIEDEEWQSPYTRQLALLIKNDKKAISATITELSVLINKLNYRLNFVVSIIMNIFFIRLTCCI